MKAQLLFTVILSFGISLILTANPDTLLLQKYEQRARANYSANPDSSYTYARMILAECATADHPPSHAFALNWVGIAFMRKGEADSAEHYYVQTIDYCQANSQVSYLQKARLNRAINYFQQGQYTSSAVAAKEAMEAFEVSGDTLGVAHARYNLGLCLSRLKRHEEALTFYRAAEPIYLEKGRPIEKANLYNAMGSAMFDIGYIDSSIAYQKQAAAVKIEAAGSYLCASEFNNIATSLKKLGEIDSAEHYYHAAIEAATTLGDNRAHGLALLNLALLFSETERYDSAFHYAQLGNAYADSTGDLFIKAQAAMNLSKAYYGLGQSDSAYAFRVRFQDLNDSIRNNELSERVVAMEKEYRLAETERQVAEGLLMVKEKELLVQRQLLTILLMSAGAILFLILILTVFRRYRKRKQIELERAALATEQEKTRIAMDLHDHLGAELTLITSRLDTTVFQSNHPSEKESLSAIADQVRKANSTLRETVWSVRAETITVDQLIDRISAFARKMLADTDLQFEAESDTLDVELEPNLALNVYRLLQEGVTNAFKYSEASLLQLNIAVKQNRLHVKLKDDGVGFDNPKGGYGLQNMRTRVKQLNGKVDISGADGCALSFEFPIFESDTD